MVQIELFFGRDIAGQGTVSDAEWDAFASTVLAREFPDGSTTLAAQGQWFDPQAGQTIHEPSMLVLVSTDPASDFEMKVERVVDAYKQRFHQQSVGVVTHDVCARF